MISAICCAGGPLHRQAQPHEEEKSDEADDHHQFQCKSVIDGCSGVGRVNAHGLQNRSHAPPNR